jgi:hypothetical protein
MSELVGKYILRENDGGWMIIEEVREIIPGGYFLVRQHRFGSGLKIMPISLITEDWHGIFDTLDEAKAEQERIEERREADEEYQRERDKAEREEQ